MGRKGIGTRKKNWNKLLENYEKQTNFHHTILISVKRFQRKSIPSFIIYFSLVLFSYSHTHKYIYRIYRTIRGRNCFLRDFVMKGSFFLVLKYE